MLEVRLLGQFEVKLGGQPVSIPSRPAQALLAYLILNARAAHRREQLAGLLWPDTSDENARNNLRHALWRIRKAIETKQAYLITDDLKVQFDPDSQYWLDVQAVDHKLNTDVSVDELIEALANYRGELLPGFYEEWVTLERERLQAMFERKMEQLLDCLISAQRWADTLEWGEKWIALGQTPEPAYRALMLAHTALGNSAKVAATYERCVQALNTDLGVPPSEQTRALYQRLSSPPDDGRDAKVDRAKKQPSRAAHRSDATETLRLAWPAAPIKRTANIPSPLTSFIGRAREIEEIKTLLATNRLVTLAGAGGSGKTRLAIAVANAVSDIFQ
ncbi:MAG TPA: BTAD domain-containing putative transcriptional regulator, partial [Anaerolineae bacterium]|nr:BTAD domain-containing putative transcriptional regulator [Anaerolineae bacterium]